MNETAPVAEMQALQPHSDPQTKTAALFLDSESMNRMMDAAKMMASAKVTIPQHLRGSTGDCMAVILQAMQWGMNPFAVAQKTHLSQGGQLGYEAQLINAVIVSSGAITGQPDFEFIGDWGKILGKVKEMKSDKGGKYYVADWNPAHEEGLGVICRATLRGETEPREITVMMSQCYPRFSTQWATDPQQQITYVAVRKFSRRFAPGAILGVYTPEELEDYKEPTNIQSAPQKQSGKQTAEKAAEAQRAKVQADADERNNLILDLETICKESGQKAFRDAWNRLTKEQRLLIGSEERARLDTLAFDVTDAEFSEVLDGEPNGAGTQEDQPHE